MRSPRPVQLSYVICTASLALSGCGSAPMSGNFRNKRKQTGAPGAGRAHLDTGEVSNMAQAPAAETDAPPSAKLSA